MEFIIVGVIIVVAGYILYSNIKKQASGDCGCGNGCKGCSHSCEIKPPNKIQ
ncbi:FeoB-associated Cys-rich membrane protein [Clostridium sp. CF011]|uniref:FeoB-associated Cys-rich membrane protein n=1 Tax=Clostridium TaxID=1485 RepID=UPI0013EE8692|nr:MULTISPECIES: FeoB-associated Cys-rich membrane protein [Clostridium]MBU3090559.1 FeoB-associated Cys-rich membrane protein [Clostridium sp. CF011]MBZ9608729.1 FeoB-associated Cys-rich membrane protein [Clostridium estertheticum]WAG69917.1 FeoB-associated Cys-rich membrane protein [Clostridium sp. CF011]